MVNREQEADREQEQIYIDEDEFPIQQHKEKNIQTEEIKEEPIGDVYDVYSMASRVHSKLTDMTRDYTLAKYNSDIVNAKFPTFIREQRKIVRIIEVFLLSKKREIRKRYKTQEEYERAYEIIKRNYTYVKKLLLAELDELVIMSRTGQGQVIDAVLNLGKTKEEIEQQKQPPTTTTGKLMEETK